MFLLFLLIPVLMPLQLRKLQPTDADNAVTFNIKNFGINTKGEFKGLKGAIQWDAANPSNSKFDVTIDAATIDTGIKSRDNDLRDEKYFDVKNHPVIRMTSTKVTADQFVGNLTIKGTTRAIAFPYTVNASSGGGVNFKASFTIRRSDFGIGGGSTVLSDYVQVDLDVMAK